MTGAPPVLPQWRRAIATTATRPVVLWSAFILTHLWLGYLNLNATGLPLGDVTFVYKYWAEQAAYTHFYVGIDSVWVYPILALLPIVAAATFGFDNYAGTWLSIVFILDLVAFAAMVGWRKPLKSPAIGWWWIAFLLLLGPISMGRIDSITVPIAIVAVLFLAARPRVAAVLLTIAMWIKVWPAAALAAIIIASHARWRVFAVALTTSVGIIVFAFAFGAGTNVFSFIGQQTGRGLQVEAPVSTIWMWFSFAKVPGAFVYYDQDILTYQVGGPGAEVAAAVMMPILVVAALAIGILGVIAVRRGTAVSELLPTLVLAFIVAFIAFNKVGSPQYMTWLAVPIILGLATSASGYGRSFRTPAVIVLLIGALTQLFYPYYYLNLLEVDPFFVSVLTARNLLLFVLLGWTVRVLFGLTRRVEGRDFVADSRPWLSAAWPFGGRLAPEIGSERPSLADRAMLDERFSEGD